MMRGALSLLLTVTCAAAPCAQAQAPARSASVDFVAPGPRPCAWQRRSWRRWAAFG